MAITREGAPLRRLAGMLTDEETEAAQTLAEARQAEVGDVPHLVRLLEETAALRRCEELIARGETRTYAIRRTAQEIGVPMSTLHYRLWHMLGD